MSELFHEIKGISVSSSEPDHELFSMAKLIGAYWREPDETRIQAVVARGASPLVHDEHFRTPLHWASFYGLETLPRVLVSCGWSVDPRDDLGRTPLMFSKDARIAALLISLGANPDLADDSGRTAEDYAAFAGLPDLAAVVSSSRKIRPPVSSFLSSMPDPDDRFSPESSEPPSELVSEIGQAVSRADESLFRVALKDSSFEWDADSVRRSGASPFVFERASGRTALHLAAISCDASLVSALLSAGWSPDARDFKGASPLHFASSPSVATLLVEARASLSLRTEDGSSPLHRAASSGNLSIVRLLLSSGADPLALDVRRRSPLHRSVAAGANAISALLVSRSPSAAFLFDSDGLAPPALVSSYGASPSVFKAFVKAGVNPYKFLSKGVSLVQSAASPEIRDAWESAFAEIEAHSLRTAASRRTRAPSPSRRRI